MPSSMILRIQVSISCKKIYVHVAYSTTFAFSVHFIPWDEEPCTEIIRDAQADWSDALECTPFGQRCELIYNLSSIPEKNSDSRSA